MTLYFEQGIILRSTTQLKANRKFGCCKFERFESCLFESVKFLVCSVIFGTNRVISNRNVFSILRDRERPEPLVSTSSIDRGRNVTDFVFVANRKGTLSSRGWISDREILSSWFLRRRLDLTDPTRTVMSNCA